MQMRIVFFFSTEYRLNTIFNRAATESSRKTKPVGVVINRQVYIFKSVQRSVRCRFVFRPVKTLTYRYQFMMQQLIIMAEKMDSFTRSGRRIGG